MRIKKILIPLLSSLSLLLSLAPAVAASPSALDTRGGHHPEKHHCKHGWHWDHHQNCCVHPPCHSGWEWHMRDNCCHKKKHHCHHDEEWDDRNNCCKKKKHHC